MKRIGIVLFAAVLLASCNDNGQSYNYPQQQVQVNIEKPQVTVTDEDATGLDLQAAGTLAYQVFSTGGTAETFQQELNKSGGINNVDLDNDGKIDFLAVTEGVGAGNERKFVITDYLSDGPTQVASITANHTASEGSIAVDGNPNLYTGSQSYQSNFTLGDAATIAAFAYLWGTPHTAYVSPYSRYGYYPSYYGGYRHVSPDVYTRQVQTVRTVKSIKYSTPVAKSTPKSNSWKTTSTASSSLTKEKTNYRAEEKARSYSNATTSQRSFEVRDRTKPVATGGFGSNKSTTTTTASSTPSTRKFGSSNNTFGTSSSSSTFRSSSSSGSGFGSSSSSKRSSGFGSSRSSGFGSSSKRKK